MKYTNLKEKAYLIIKNKIIDCKLMPGEMIDEQELIKEIEVSRTPIREALNKLENEKLIIIYPRRGIFVKSITEKDIYDIFEVRKIIEPYAAKLATHTIKTEDLEYFYNFYYSKDQYSLIEHLDIGRKFHTLIYNSTYNQYLKTIALNIYDQCSRIRHLLRIAYKETGEFTHYEGHLEIIKALMKRDKKKVEETMRTHIESLEKSCSIIPYKYNLEISELKEIM